MKIKKYKFKSDSEKLCFNHESYIDGNILVSRNNDLITKNLLNFKIMHDFNLKNSQYSKRDNHVLFTFKENNGNYIQFLITPKSNMYHLPLDMKNFLESCFILRDIKTMQDLIDNESYFEDKEI